MTYVGSFPRTFKGRNPSCVLVRPGEPYFSCVDHSLSSYRDHTLYQHHWNSDGMVIGDRYGGR